MKDKGGGTIIHFGARPKATEKRGAYFASKAALQALVQTAQAEFSPFGVRVLLVESLEACLEACDP
jgi:NAD(P)-dependent dehydrogenase (short-subunit alcohol dehydrogenase family)